MRSTTTRALIVCTMVLALSGLAGPAFAGHDTGDSEDGYSERYGSDERAGHGSRLELQVECDAIEANSNHKISTVTVYFADGTEEEIEVDAREYSETFTNTIDHAVAESHKGWVADEAADCEVEPEPSETPSGSDDDGDDADDADDSDPDDGDDSASDGDASRGSGGAEDGASRDDSDADRDTTRDATDARTTSDDDVNRAVASSDAASAGSSAATRPTGSALGSGGLTVTGNAEVFGMVFHQGIKTCPSGPFKGMPYVDIKDCGDSVLGTRLALTGSSTGVFTALGLGLVALGGLLLRVRRSRGVV